MMRRFALMTFVLALAGGLPATAGAADPPTCAGLPATIWGTTGDDVLEGTTGPDVIAGLGGDDTIDGLRGDDVICGDQGDDVIVGGPGDDLIVGGPGNDRIDGGGGDDELRGGIGNDRMRGGDGADVLEGQGNRDRLRGNAGDDVLAGGNHADVLIGGFGNDTLSGGPNVDECYGEHLGNCEVIPLARGDRGDAVVYLQRTLRARKLYRGPVDGVFDLEVAVAVATFHKATGPAFSDPTTAVGDWKANPPSERMSYDDWEALLAFEPREPKTRDGQPDRVEVDIGRQVLYLILDGEVDAIVHVSTGHDPDDTPRTDHLPDGGYFWYQHPYNGWSPRPGAWSIYKFWAYRAGREYNYGVHGYRDVPYWPASHGCTRVHVWEADYLHPRIFVGMPMHVWDE